MSVHIGKFVRWARDGFWKGGNGVGVDGRVRVGKLFNGRGGFASRGVSYEGGFIQKCTVGGCHVGLK